MEMFNMPIEEANNIMRQNHYNLEVNSFLFSALLLISFPIKKLQLW